MIEPLVSMALLGTRGNAPRMPELPDEVAQTLAACTSPSAEEQLLDAIVTAALYARCGATPRTGAALPEPSPADQLKACSRRADDILAQILEAGPEELLVEWLDCARASGRRPSHRLLPRLLETGAAKKDLRTAINAVVDERGRWLMQFNSRWQFSSPSTQPAEEIWQEGNRQQRAEILRTMRTTEPGKARELVQTTWSADPAEERAEWLANMIPGLSAADEPFLESCLDDRSSKVREAAADLLVRLDDTALVRRMIQRISPLLSFTPGVSGSLIKLKRATKATIDIKLPEAFEKSRQRDGMTEKPAITLGPKQWWLYQMLGAVPLAYWTKHFKADAATIVEAVPEEFAEVLIRGWMTSLSRRPEPDWIAPLVSAAPIQLPLEPHVLEAIPPPARASVLEQIASKSTNIQQFQAAIQAWRPLAVDVSKVILDRFEPRIILGLHAFYFVHPDAFAQLESMLANVPDEPYQRKAKELGLSVIAMRREIHKEFAQ